MFNSGDLVRVKGTEKVLVVGFVFPAAPSRRQIECTYVDIFDHVRNITVFETVLEKV